MIRLNFVIFENQTYNIVYINPGKFSKLFQNFILYLFILYIIAKKYVNLVYKLISFISKKVRIDKIGIKNLLKRT